MSYVRLVTPLLAATMLAATGCGGSSKTTSTVSTAAQPTTTTAAQTQPESSGPPLSSAQLIAKADLICARLNAVRLSTVIKSKQQLLDSFTRLASDEQRAVEEMNKLTPSSSLAGAWSSMIASYRTIAADTATIKQDLTENKSVGSLVSTITQLQRQTTATARKAGFKDCGRI